MFSNGQYRVMVTYRDGSGLWKDHPVAHEYLQHREVRPQEREVDCFIPSFWSSVPRFTRIFHVGFTESGRTTQLPWPPADMDQPTWPALAMRFRLRSRSGDSWSQVEWGANGAR
jgi:hypothetical protein